MDIFLYLTLIVLFVFFYLSESFTKFSQVFSVNITSNIIMIFVLIIFILLNLFIQLSNNNVITIYIINSFYYVIGLDKLSFIFVILTVFLIILCSIYNIKNIITKSFTWFFIIISMFLGLIITFIAQDLILFLVGFEFVLIPLFWIVIEFGSRTNRVFASYFLVIVTLFGSSFFLIALFLLYIENFSISFQSLAFYSNYISEVRQSLIWFFLLVGLIVKIPLIPLHLWLPEAHAEAPTIGSVLLAGVVLKLGTYGMIRCLIFLFSNSEIFFSSILVTFGLINIMFSAIVSLIQLDIKKAIAYGSIAHIGLVVAGLGESFYLSESGSILIIIFHGVVSPLLFFIVGSLYDRISTRNYYYFGSLSIYSPLLAIQWFFAVLGNVAFPGTASFVGELQVLISLVIINPFIALLIIFATFVNLIWNFLLIIRIIFISSKSWSILFFQDISLKEFSIFSILNFWSLLPGIFVADFLSFIEYSFYYI